MSKVIIFSIITFFSFFFLTNTAFAVSCEFTYGDASFKQDMGNLVVTFTSNDLNTGVYWVRETAPKFTRDFLNINFSNGTGTLTVEKGNRQLWDPGSYALEVMETGKSASLGCKALFTIQEQPQQTNCQPTMDDTPINPNTPVNIDFKGLQLGRDYKVYLSNVSGAKIINGDKKNFPYSSTSWGTFQPGAYNIYLTDVCHMISCREQLQCPVVSFEVVPLGTPGGGRITPSPSPPGGPVVPGGKITAISCTVGKNCTAGAGKQCKNGAGIETAIGCLETAPAALVQNLLKLATMAGGGVALLLMIAGAFRFITSSGNPEALKAASEQFTSAIIGLLFIVFAVLLLKIIGVDILAIPGFVT